MGGVRQPVSPLANAHPSAPGSPLRIASIAQNASGTEFEFPTEAGASYRLEGSEDLKTWSLLLDDVAGTGGPFQVRDPEAATFQRYFYRVIQK